MVNIVSLSLTYFLHVICANSIDVNNFTLNRLFKYIVSKLCQKLCRLHRVKTILVISAELFMCFELHTRGSVLRTQA